MHVKFIYIVLIFSFSTISQAKPFEHTYKTYTLSKTTLEEVASKQGAPKKIKETNRTIRYDYKYERYFAGQLKKVVATIAITDPNYVDINGISINDDKSKLERVFEVEVNGDNYADCINGIAYWLNNGKVTKIVLANSLACS